MLVKVSKDVCYPVFWGRKEIPSRSPSWTVFSLSLEFFKFAIFCYFWGICYSVFLGSKKNPCYFCAFNFAGFSGPFLAFSLSKSRIFFNWLFLQLLWYLHVIVSQNFLANHFFCKNCEKNLLHISTLTKLYLFYRN